MTLQYLFQLHTNSPVKFTQTYSRNVVKLAVSGKSYFDRNFINLQFVTVCGHKHSDIKFSKDIYAHINLNVIGKCDLCTLNNNKNKNNNVKCVLYTLRADVYQIKQLHFPIKVI